MKCFMVTILLTLFSGIFTCPTADSISVKVNDFTYLFSSTGDLHTVTFKESGLSKPVSIHNDVEDVISILSEYETQRISDIPEHHIIENDSQSTITFQGRDGLSLLVKQFCISKSLNTVSINVYRLGITPGFRPTGIFLLVKLNRLQNEPNRLITIDNKGKKVHSIIQKTPESINSTNWSGIRSRFTTALLRSDSDSILLDNHNDTAIRFSGTISGNDTLNFIVYAGPVKYSLLKKIGNNADRLMFPLWFWMRWLSLGIMHLFDFLRSFSGNLFVAIILLSICVKIILSPLFHIADKWQKKVNYQNGIIQPRIAEIKKQFKGEEQTHKILALHKELGISPIYTLKSLFSATIQIPIFFAAYHALSEHYALFQTSAGFIADLSRADSLLPLPFALPFIGTAINLLPFGMTTITLASSWLHTDTSMSKEMLKKQRTNLYFMALLFFVLLYTSPAGMVLYWTMNNLLAFLSTVFTSFFQHRKHQSLKGNVP